MKPLLLAAVMLLAVNINARCETVETGESRTIYPYGELRTVEGEVLSIYYLVLCTAYWRPPLYVSSNVPLGEPTPILTSDSCISGPIIKNEQEAALAVWEFKKTHGNFHHAELWRFDGEKLEQVPIPKIPEIRMKKEKP